MKLAANIAGVSESHVRAMDKKLAKQGKKPMSLLAEFAHKSELHTPKLKEKVRAYGRAKA